MTASASRCIHLISVAFQYSATLQTGGLSINCIYVLSVYPTLTFFISLDFILCGIAFGVNFFIVCRLKICINISNLVLTNCNSCCMISNVSGRHDRHNNLCASGSVGGARPCQGRGRGFESRLALLLIVAEALILQGFRSFYVVVVKLFCNICGQIQKLLHIKYT